MPLHEGFAFGCFFLYLLNVKWVALVRICFRVPAVEQHMGGGKQHRGPFQGVRVKNSVKELLLHFRSSKQMSSAPATEESKVTGGFLHWQLSFQWLLKLARKLFAVMLEKSFCFICCGWNQRFSFSWKNTAGKKSERFAMREGGT